MSTTGVNPGVDRRTHPGQPPRWGMPIPCGTAYGRRHCPGARGAGAERRDHRRPGERGTVVRGRGGGVGRPSGRAAPLDARAAGDHPVGRPGAGPGHGRTGPRCAAVTPSPGNAGQDGSEHPHPDHHRAGFGGYRRRPACGYPNSLHAARRPGRSAALPDVGTSAAAGRFRSVVGHPAGLDGVFRLQGKTRGLVGAEFAR